MTPSASPEEAAFSPTAVAAEATATAAPTPTPLPRPAFSLPMDDYSDGVAPVEANYSTTELLLDDGHGSGGYSDPHFMGISKRSFSLQVKGRTKLLVDLPTWVESRRQGIVCVSLARESKV